uniref:Uncharacterized protein LOC117367174 isoform X4 n=1 Tax=Geotrypetes seraphini TaxID=260995 RepID=A0A6P8SFL7_GEOSA|nr:uncharacterized protein LOC117367174 isoform X4 [Geotrypetes seraphini]
MERGIERQFIEDRSFLIEMLPLVWGVKRPGPHYCLNMKMSQLKNLVFSFEFGATDPRQDFPVTDFPERIVKLDISLNELEKLPAESLLPFENLSELDASLNALSDMEGVGVVRNLAVLNLSYNAITGVRRLEPCGQLVLLNISHNQVRTIRGLPLLSSLTQLHLGSNKGNPLARDNRYVTAVKESTTVEILDNSLLRSPSVAELHHSFSRDFLPTGLLEVEENKEALKDSARKTLVTKLQKKQEDVESIIHYLHGRILSLQEDLKEYEDSLWLEMEGCIRYINAIPSEDFQSIDPQKVPKTMERHLFSKFWERWDYGKRRPGNLPFTDLVKPEELLCICVDIITFVWIHVEEEVVFHLNRRWIGWQF